MVNVTTRHFRQLIRFLTSRSTLWTEMVKVNCAFLSSAEERSRLLDFDSVQRPLVLQLAGPDPRVLGWGAALAAPWGFDEINLNCGCPSERLGAGMMRDPDTAAAAAAAMLEGAGAQARISVKCRLAAHAVDDPPSFRCEEMEYLRLREFVRTVSRAGVRRFYVHARSALLGGARCANREAPPLRPALVQQLAHEFPELEIVINGGIVALEGAAEVCRPPLRGVMVARAIRDKPYLCSCLDQAWFKDASSVSRSRREVLEAYLAYVEGFIASSPPALEHGRASVGYDQWLRSDLGMPLLYLFANERGDESWRAGLIRWLHGEGPSTAAGLRAAVEKASAGLGSEVLDAKGLPWGATASSRLPESAPGVFHLHPALQLPGAAAGLVTGEGAGGGALAAAALGEGEVLLSAKARSLPEGLARTFLGRRPNCSAVCADTEKAAGLLTRRLTVPGAAPVAVGSVCLVCARPIEQGEPVVLARSLAAQAFAQLLGP